MLPVPNPADDALIREIAATQGFSADVHYFDLVGGCGTNATLNGCTWRVFEPETLRAFVLCLADVICISDVANLGLDAQTTFVCRQSALDDETRAFLARHANLKFI